MGQGGRRSGTWPKGKKPPVKKPKGRKNNKTILKEAIGLENWEGLKNFIEGEGATKLVAEMKKLKGRNYVAALTAMAEFVKPKLRRVDGSMETTISFKDKKVEFK